MVSRDPRTSPLPCGPLLSGPLVAASQRCLQAEKEPEPLEAQETHFPPMASMSEAQRVLHSVGLAL